MSKYIKVFILIIFLIITISSNVQASDITISTIFGEAEGFIETGKEEAKGGLTMDTKALTDASSTIYNILLGVGTAVAVIVGAMLGIQFMTAGIEQKVEVKKTLPAYLISCIVLFGAFGIWKLVVTLLKGI